MISGIRGILRQVEKGRAQVQLDSGLTYELLIPAYVQGRIGSRIDQEISFHTVHFLEGSSQGNNFTPRLAAFTSETDRQFYELFTTVKGIGARKALRAMTLSTAQIANAIADRDTAVLQSLPEIGKRMAETIVATLHGKVDPFVSEQAYVASEGAAADESPAPSRAAAREALAVLMQLGESRPQAMQWIDQVLTRQPELDSAEAIITEALRLRSSS
jgi:Holliday junction DNA helicase RuvA